MIVLICTCKQIYFYLDLECHSLTNIFVYLCHALNIVTCSCLQSESGEWSVPGAGGERGAGGECVPIVLLLELQYYYYILLE